MSMDQMTNRAEQLIEAISSSIMSATEAAAERISLAAEVARVRTRMSAFGSVLEAIAVQKEALAERTAAANGAVRALLQQQIELLTAQEVAVLQKAGLGGDMAAQAVAVVEEQRPSHRRSGSRFVPVNGK